MIIVSHDYIHVQEVAINEDLISFDATLKIGELIYEIAKKYPDEIIIWTHKSVKQVINLEYVTNAFPHDRLLFSYTPFGNFFPDAIGYVEDNPFININKEVQYPTWQMSSYVGAVKGKTILLTDSKLWKANSFDFCLNAIAKTYQSYGMFCYSNPQLIRETVLIKSPKATYKDLFEFVNQHYKKSWTYLLLINLFLYEKKIPIIPFLSVLFKEKKVPVLHEIKFELPSSNLDFSEHTIDVIIPTIGRKKYLYDVLNNLKSQSHLPKNVIIVEQNPLLDSVSELDFINNESWPFAIKHIFTHQTGACQARNKALAEVKSKWCFFADDDIVFSNCFLEDALKQIVTLQLDAALFSCLLKNQTNTNFIISQTGIFGSGCSIVSFAKLTNLHFDEKLEFGYGEDTEFGLQLRNKGADIVYFPFPEIIHLKVPVGGFRTKFVHPWELESIQPKPSPTVLYFRLKYYTQEQVFGYKTVLFLKFYKSQSIKNPFVYFRVMKKRWKASLRWTNTLLQKDEI